MTFWKPTKRQERLFWTNTEGDIFAKLIINLRYRRHEGVVDPDCDFIFRTDYFYS